MILWVRTAGRALLRNCLPTWQPQTQVLGSMAGGGGGGGVGCSADLVGGPQLGSARISGQDFGAWHCMSPTSRAVSEQSDFLHGCSGSQGMFPETRPCGSCKVFMARPEEPQSVPLWHSLSPVHENPLLMEVAGRLRASLPWGVPRV